MVLVVFGLIMVFSASYYYSISQDGNPYSYLLRHGMWVVLGFGAMMFGASYDYKRYNNKKFAYLVIGGSILLLIIVITPLGTTIIVATIWINLGHITFMQ
ncbi:MAG: FtsW/RodA/SpoVE family cell cycle protein, partial [Firmicutes bacterium]|nr:FtsW/RodA/SpoVE family cell cycle protein [Bacillota bacterium]